MTDPKQLIELVKQYGARIQRLDNEHIRVIHHENLPSELIEQLRSHKLILIKYLEQSFLDVALKRALDGYDWLLERKEQQYRHNHIPVSEVSINVTEWRTAIADVIGLDACEVELVESILINRGDLVYYNHDRCIMSYKEVTQGNDYLPDNRTGQAFYDWLDSGRQFVYS